eukprot:TRINITY_DN31453_c1_g1_i1.p1 TRINITY_DN31453_c1_g1~~TRINITY_DN31453_c1_g1_i1.p1  ORF type:complete len:442 (+),score=124.08 TRINITY_DN31453_c1_g1_i1:104-1429(+)
MAEATMMMDHTQGYGAPPDMTMPEGGAAYDATMPEGEPYAGASGELDGGYSHGGTQMPEGFETLDSHVRGAHAPHRLSDEERLAQKIASRRKMEAERRSRIFDAKRRTIGVDKDMLDYQCEEKNQQRAHEKAMKNADGNLMYRVDRELKLIEVQKQARQRELETACKNYSLQTLNFESRREFDLNDPLSKRKSLPSRVGDDDPRCGVSSMQQFNGEDLLKERRVRQQQQQMRDYIEQQKFEKAMLTEDSAGDGRRMAEEVAEITAMRNEMEETENRMRRQMALEQQYSNLQKYQETVDKRRTQRETDEHQNQRELDFHYQDPFLNETGVKYKANGAVLRDTYKGSTREERVEVAHIQRDQCIENDEKRGGEKMEEMIHHHSMESCRKHLVATERARSIDKRKKAMMVAQENRVMHAEKANRPKMNNEIHPAFFEQFGTGVR